MKYLHEDRRVKIFTLRSRPTNLKDVFALAVFVVVIGVEVSGGIGGSI